MMRRHSGVRGLIVGSGILFATTAAPAAKLDQAACDALKTEQTQLTSAGVKTDMQRGPDWAKANLAPERLQQIQRFIAVDEQLTYRCADLKTPKPANAGPSPTTEKKGRTNAKAPGAGTGQAAAEPTPDAQTPDAAVGKAGATPKTKSSARRTSTKAKSATGAGTAIAPLSP